jgi:DNA-binding protein YbaB
VTLAAAQEAQLRLLAEDAEDLEIIAAALQDAVGKIGDIHYDAAARQVTVGLNRFRWESDTDMAERVRTGLQFGGVLSVQARKLRRDAPDAVLELLTIEFEPGEAPGGVVQLSFAGGGDLRLEVECVDAALADVSAPWPAKGTPVHGD